MVERFSRRFEQGLANFSLGLGKPRTDKSHDKLLVEIGRLQQMSHGIAQYYTIIVTPDETGKKAVSYP